MQNRWNSDEKEMTCSPARLAARRSFHRWPRPALPQAGCHRRSRSGSKRSDQFCLQLADHSRRDPLRMSASVLLTASVHRVPEPRAWRQPFCRPLFTASVRLRSYSALSRLFPRRIFGLIESKCWVKPDCIRIRNQQFGSSINSKLPRAFEPSLRVRSY